jgi:predicted MPP superfamily phosphohydrolase
MVNKYSIILDNLPKEFDGFTIVQFADLHYGFLTPLSLARKVISKIIGIPRDMIVCTGDYVHQRDNTKQIDTILPEFEKLSAPCSVFSVLGNHDHWANAERTIYWLDKFKQNIRHKTRCFSRGESRLWFIGAGDLWEDHLDIDHITKSIPENDCKIVLAHNPDTADTFYEQKINLFISGHTHGGQVNIPLIGTPVLPVKNKNYSFGLKYAKNSTPVFISKGIGWAIYQVRFNCFPEIPVLTLKCKVS